MKYFIDTYTHAIHIYLIPLYRTLVTLISLLYHHHANALFFFTKTFNIHHITYHIKARTAKNDDAAKDITFFFASFFFCS